MNRGNRCARWLRVAAGKARSAPRQNRTPSTQDQFGPRRAACARRQGSRSARPSGACLGCPSAVLLEKEFYRFVGRAEKVGTKFNGSESACPLFTWLALFLWCAGRPL